jgi:hypothetical protein
MPPIAAWSTSHPFRDCSLAHQCSREIPDFVTALTAISRSTVIDGQLIPLIALHILAALEDHIAGAPSRRPMACVPICDSDSGSPKTTRVD